MAMKKSKGKGVVATGGKGTTAPKPAASSGQMKMAQRPIKVLGKMGSGKGKK